MDIKGDVMFKVGAVAILMFSMTAQANDTWLEVNGVSKHIGQDSYTWNGQTKKFNETNFGLGISRTFGDYVEVKGGFYENSYYKNTKYLAVATHLNFKVGEVIIKPGVQVGVVTGYENTPELADKYQPIGYLTAAFEYKQVRAVVGFLPSKSFGGNINVATFQLGLKFK